METLLVKNENGFAAMGLALLVSGVALAILLPTYLSNSMIERTFLTSSIAAQTKQNLVNAVSMVFHERTDCAVNIPAGFGATLAELKTRSAGSLLKVIYPGGSNTIMLEPNADFGAARIIGVVFDVATTPFFGTNYAATLTVSFRLKSSLDRPDSPLFQVRIPFYFLADAAGTITGCQSTLPWTGDMRECTTLEDYACQKQFGKPATPTKVFKYKPDSGNCAETVAGANGVSTVLTTTTCKAN